MKYTIAIPAYNNSKIIRNAINSCIGQKTDFDYEIIISDDASTDNSQEIYEEFKGIDNLRVIYHESNSSLYENHNRCLKYATGRYVLFCHADDTLYDDALTKLDATLKKYEYPNKIVCWGRSFFRDFNRAYKRVAGLNTIVSGIEAQNLFQYGGLSPAGVCYSRDSFLKSGGFLPMVDRITPSDMSSMIKFSLDGGEFLMTDRVLFKREFASTAKNLTSTIRFHSNGDALKELSKVIGADAMARLFENINSFERPHLPYVIHLSQYSINKKLKLKLVLLCLSRKPSFFFKGYILKSLIMMFTKRTI